MTAVLAVASLLTFSSENASAFVCFEQPGLVGFGLAISNHITNKVQSTLVISKLKGPSETLRDIRTSTYQIFRIEENTNRTTKFHK